MIFQSANRGSPKISSGGFELDFRHYQIGSTISREFGHYVRMNLHANYHIESNDFVEEDGSSHDGTEQIFDYGGAFEFQF